MTHPEPGPAWDGVGWAWQLTRVLSPRRLVRVAERDAAGRVLNSYPLVHPVDGLQPNAPWAMHLTDKQGRFRYLCADLDAHPDPAQTIRDAEALTGLLSEFGVPAVVCASGPGGGRHVWVGLADPVDAERAAVLARLLRVWLHTMDVAPLTNPSTGCVRPPGAPHRGGGASHILAGDLDTLVHPTVTSEQFDAVLTAVAARVNHHPTRTSGRPRTVAYSPDGLPYLAGARRTLPARTRRLLDQPLPPAGDASSVLWRILCSAAAARWQFSDLAAHMAAPSLEHARTLRDGTRRIPRPAAGASSPDRVLRRQWTRAVTAVATSVPPQAVGGDDPTFELRAQTITGVVRAVQARADASPGCWHGPRGPVRRRVLDVVCLYQLQAVRLDVEADIRRLALTAGTNRETARQALLSLQADGWLARTRPAHGVRAAHWTTDPTGALHTRVSGALSQANPRPAGVGPAERAALLNELADRLTTSSHDAFAPIGGGLGAQAGNLYGRLATPHTTLELALLFGWNPSRTADHLDTLAAAGLITSHEHRWHRTPDEHLEQAATEAGTTGLLGQRAERYQAERAAWAWWLTELQWMRATKPCPPPSVGRHPRRRDGRANFAQALRTVRAHPRTPGHAGAKRERVPQRPKMPLGGS